MNIPRVLMTFFIVVLFISPFSSFADRKSVKIKKPPMNTLPGFMNEFKSTLKNANKVPLEISVTADCTEWAVDDNGYYLQDEHGALICGKMFEDIFFAKISVFTNSGDSYGYTGEGEPIGPILELIGSEITDSNGKLLIFLEPWQYYKIFIKKSGFKKKMVIKFLPKKSTTHKIDIILQNQSIPVDANKVETAKLHSICTKDQAGNNCKNSYTICSPISRIESTDEFRCLMPEEAEAIDAVISGTKDTSPFASKTYSIIKDIPGITFSTCSSESDCMEGLICTKVPFLMNEPNAPSVCLSPNEIQQETQFLASPTSMEIISQFTCMTLPAQDFFGKNYNGEKVKKMLDGVCQYGEGLLVKPTPSKNSFNFHCGTLTTIENEACDGDQWSQGSSPYDECWDDSLLVENRSLGGTHGCMFSEYLFNFVSRKLELQDGECNAYSLSFGLSEYLHDEEPLFYNNVGCTLPSFTSTINNMGQKEQQLIGTFPYWWYWR